MLLVALWMVATDPAKALIDQWLEAQNNGDFAAYEKLYARKFTGVRRSGAHTVRMDRKAWMRDRQRMFKKSMHVEASQVRIVPMASGAQATFIQDWRSEKYHDVGPKQLILWPDGGALRIAREEMLESKVRTTWNEALSLAEAQRLQFAFMVDGRIALAPEAHEEWTTGPIVPSKVEGNFDSAARKVDVAKLPEAIRAWKGRKVRVFDTSGPVCEAQVTGFEYIRRVVSHFGVRQEWREKGTSAKDIAREVWETSEGSDILLGTVDKQKACKAGTWARDAALPAPKIMAAESVDAALAKSALREFRKLAAWKKTQTEYLTYDGVPKGNWDEFDGAKPEVKKIGSLVFVTATAGHDCGEFGGQLWALWELQGGKLVLRHDPDEYDYLVPEAGVDIDGDGKLELLIENGILRSYKDAEKLEVPDHDCPC